MKQLMAALGQDIKPSGKHWIARCPVHCDKDFAMKIKQTEDNSVIAHCHACGANGLDLYKMLGLDLEELFGGKKRDILDKPYLPSRLKIQYETDKMCIHIHESDLEKGSGLNYKDKRRYRLAVARVKGVEDKFTI